MLTPHHQTTPHTLAAADVPACVRGQTVVSCHPKDYAGVDFVFSALDASVAGDVEAAFRDAGIPVFSNAKNYRMVRARLLPRLHMHELGVRVVLVVHIHCVGIGGLCKAAGAGRAACGATRQW